MSMIYLKYKIFNLKLILPRNENVEASIDNNCLTIEVWVKIILTQLNY